LFVDDVAVARLGRPPYRVLWQVEAGTHQVRAIGVDAEGQPVESQVVQFAVLEEEPRVKR
jgi:hypothetical protein